MDKAALKMTLSAYRAGSADAGDPQFAEALRAVEADPELAAWFAEEQRFDALISHKLLDAPAPAELKEMIRLNAQSPIRAVSFFGQGRRAVGWLAAAAAIVGAFIIGRVSGPRQPDARPDSLAMQGIAYTERMPSLDFVCFNAEAVKGWVETKAAALHMGRVIYQPVPNMRMIGSSAAEWNGKPVIMIALQNGDRMGMLYLLRAADFPATAQAAGEVMEKDGWASKTGRRGDHLFVLTARGKPADLNFPMPL